MSQFLDFHFNGDNLVCVRSERTVFRGLTFTVPAGGALTLVGPNGSGKSSLLRMMAGLLQPASGSMTWDGEDALNDMDVHGARLHYVGHHDAVKPVLTAAENIGFWARLRGGGDDTIQGALDVFDIKHLYDVPGRFLSAGQKRRVNLARIIAAPAPLWLLDEPTTALDKATIKRLEAAIQRHRDGGGMVVLSTHADVDTPGSQTLNLANFACSAPLDEHVMV
ncbi:heme ABC exporter ATP-binding protein CcmA [Magnetovibrio blakemorei]|uniref:Heme ABC exporter, ATP-binding protein CcmA n=1 Tax=Magnetovibrio blakemorei TaxID=28181 RepID=A0A1E5QCA7_9PROT|nr:heme ABC exporter ATP-binding protein CcmA [Magnetovibrio blakemorei]OEJ69687.1 heme ABC exporter, ATP-binding protein CcmA [Magnetovibrio blakemorei]